MARRGKTDPGAVRKMEVRYVTGERDPTVDPHLNCGLACTLHIDAHDVVSRIFDQARAHHLADPAQCERLDRF